MHQELASKVVRCALSRLEYPSVTRQDIEDMSQEAASSLWLNWTRGENYAFVCARNAVINWYHRFVLGWKRKDKSPEATPQGSAQALPQNDECNWHLAIALETRQSKLPNELHAALLRIFNNVRDVLIVQLILDGHTNEGIALELKLKPASVKRYRSEIRKKLKSTGKEKIE